jgi:hypothetical protein
MRLLLLVLAGEEVVHWLGPMFPRSGRTTGEAEIHPDLDLELHEGTRSRSGPDLFSIFLVGVLIFVHASRVSYEDF